MYTACITTPHCREEASRYVTSLILLNYRPGNRQTVMMIQKLDKDPTQKYKRIKLVGMLKKLRNDGKIMLVSTSISTLPRKMFPEYATPKIHKPDVLRAAPDCGLHRIYWVCYFTITLRHSRPLGR